MSGNSAQNHGGGVALAYGSEVAFSYTTITGNHSDADNNASGQGGGLFLDLTATAKLDHTIVAGNTDRTGTAPDVRKILGTLTPTFSLVGDNRGSGLAESNPDANGNIIGGPVGGAINPGLGPLARTVGPR